jgi:amino acid permease
MKMDENTRKIGIFSVLGLVWIASILFIMAPDLGLVSPVFPKPQQNYVLFTMLISGALLAVYSLKTGIGFLRTS